MHEVEAFLDVCELQLMGDEAVYVDGSLWFSGLKGDGCARIHKRSFDVHDVSILSSMQAAAERSGFVQAIRLDDLENRKRPGYLPVGGRLWRSGLLAVWRWRRKECGRRFPAGSRD